MKITISNVEDMSWDQQEDVRATLATALNSANVSTDTGYDFDFCNVEITEDEDED